VRHVATDVPLLGAVRERVEPDLSPRGEGNVHVEREAGAAQEVEHRRVCLPGAAIFVKPATTTSPTQREHRGLSFSCIIPIPGLHACGCAFEPLSVGVPPFPQERTTTRTTLVAPPHLSHPRLRC
jgi:hypothetical protein